MSKKQKKAIKKEKKKVKKKKKKAKKKQKKKAKKEKKRPGRKFAKGMTVEQMLVELIEMGICKKLEPATIQDFVGEDDPLRHLTEQQYGKEFFPNPSMAQLRQIVTLHCIFPFGSKFIRNTLKRKENMFLFYGSPGTGKTLMVRAIA